MSDLTTQLDEARRRWDTLRHPFYQRWERGELRSEDLALYSGQYRHAVVALADLAARGGDSEHAREERAHVALWDDFVAACGGEPAEPLPETRELVATFAAVAPGAEADAVLYAIEASQPPVSQTKLDGLVGHYGFAPEGAGTGYFRIHAELENRTLRGGRSAGDGERKLGGGAGVRGIGAGCQLGLARRRQRALR